MNEADVLHFLAALAILLAGARLLGELSRKVGLPLVCGELLTGVLLGPTLLGRLFPGSAGWTQPVGIPRAMIGAYTNMGLVLLLVVAGLEVDLGVVRRRFRGAVSTSILGLVVPMAAGVLLGMALPDTDLKDPSHRILFALFLGVALAISALPVIAKTLLDLGLYKTDLGLLVMSSAMIDDLVGWLAFSLLVGPMRGEAIDLRHLGVRAALTLGFAGACLGLLRPAVDIVLAKIERGGEPAGGRMLSLVIVLGLAGAVCTEAIGIHAIFGAFVVGVTVGDSKALREKTRLTIHDFVTNVFAPVFFATLGLRVDFVRAFDLRLDLLVFAIACAGKIIGCSLGARHGKLAWRQAVSVAFGLNARGAMEILLATIALDAGLIGDRVYVALVLMALGTSMLSGPMMKALLGPPEAGDPLVAALDRGTFLPRLEATTAREAIEELVAAVGDRFPDGGVLARGAVLEREATAPTGLGKGVAVPHAAVVGIDAPVVALGLSPGGIDFDAPDGVPARAVFLLLFPVGGYDLEIRVLGSISKAMLDPGVEARVLAADSAEAARAALGGTGPATGRST